jgi:hypothetical protein
MITIEPMTPDQFNELTGIKEIDGPKNPKENPATTADIVVIAIKEALIESKIDERKLSLLTDDGHCGVIKVWIEIDNEKGPQLCEHNPEEGDFEEVITMFEKEWAGQFAKKPITGGGTRYTFFTGF